MESSNKQSHKHHLVLLGRLQGELGGDYPVYWCRDCGVVWEVYGKSYAELVPEYRKEVAGSDNFEFVRNRPNTVRRKSSGSVLGRGLIEINASTTKGTKLQELFFGENKNGKG